MGAPVSLRDRLVWVLETGRFANASAWSRDAGLARQHVTTLLARLEDQPDRRIETRTLQSLADAAAVSRAWMIEGVGRPDDLEPVSVHFAHGDEGAVHAARAFVELHRGDEDGGDAAERIARSVLAEHAGERWTPDEWLEEIRTAWRRGWARVVGGGDVVERVTTHVRPRRS